MRKKKNKIQAGNLLFENGYYQEATVIFWQLIRDQIFCYLEENKIDFDSTREAIKEIIKHFSQDSEFITNLCFYDTIATLSEWERGFKLSKKQGKEMKSMFLIISKKLSIHG